VKEKEMGGICSTHEGNKIYIFLFRKLEGRAHLGDVRLDGRIALKRILKD
jgi:hypothetical protein